MKQTYILIIILKTQNEVGPQPCCERVKNKSQCLCLNFVVLRCFQQQISIVCETVLCMMVKTLILWCRLWMMSNLIRTFARSKTITKLCCHVATLPSDICYNNILCKQNYRNVIKAFKKKRILFFFWSNRTLLGDLFKKHLIP